MRVISHCHRCSRNHTELSIIHEHGRRRKHGWNEILKNSFKVMVAMSFPTEPPRRKANKSPSCWNWVRSSSFLLLKAKHVVDAKGEERGAWAIHKLVTAPTQEQRQSRGNCVLNSEMASYRKGLSLLLLCRKTLMVTWKSNFNFNFPSLNFGTTGSAYEFWLALK